MDLKNLRTDATKEVEGVWVDIGEGAEILVARMNNPRFLRVLAKHRKPLGRRVDRSTELQESTMRLAIRDAILLDWKGMTDGGKSLPYNATNCLEALEVREFANIVVQAAEDFDAYLAEEEEADEGN